jgi:CRISPR-associated protein Cpf1
MENEKIFSDLTNRYQVVKTLPFELKPVPRTRVLLGLDNPNKGEIFSKDRERAENFTIIKKYIDRLHSLFINESLKKADIDFSNFYKQYGKNINTKNNKNIDDDNDINDDEKEDSENDNLKKYRQEIANLFNKSKYKSWVNVGKDGDKISGMLFEKGLIDLLRTHFSDNLNEDIEIPELFSNKKIKDTRKLKEIINSFGKDGKDGQNFTTYFSVSFHNNRKNYYKSDGKMGRVSTRIVDENLERFCKNIYLYKEIIGKNEIKEIFSGNWDIYLQKKPNFSNDKTYKKLDEFKNDKYDWEMIFRDVNSYNKYFLQSDIEFYNYIRGKLNQDINEYNGKKRDSKEKINSQFENLRNQVHGEKKNYDDDFEIDEDNIIQFINEIFVRHNQNKMRFSEKLFSDFIDLLMVDNGDKLDKVYFSQKAVENAIARYYFVEETTNEGREPLLISLLLQNAGKDRKKLSNKPIKLGDIKFVLDQANNKPAEDIFKNRYVLSESNNDGIINANDKNHWANLLRLIKKDFYFHKDNLIKSQDKLALETKYNKGSDEGERQIETIKNFAESAKAILRMTKYFDLRKNGVIQNVIGGKDPIHEEVDKYFDGDVLSGEESCRISKYYDALRNFITKKAWSADKIILNFDCSEFLGGWDRSQEQKKRGIILRHRDGDEERYYLAVLGKNGKQYFENRTLFKGCESSDWQKIEYNVIQKPHMSLPKNLITPFFKKDKITNERFIDRSKKGAKALIEIDINPSDEFLNNYNLGKHTKENLDKSFLCDYFKYLMDAIAKYYKGEFNFNFPDVSNFDNTQPFYSFIEKNAYSIKYFGISSKEIEKLIADCYYKEDVYLFQIYCKDFEIDPKIGKAKYGNEFRTKAEIRKSKGEEAGNENLNTKYFKLLFDEKNLKNQNGIVYKLNGGAKMFYRPSSIKKDEKIDGKWRYKEDKYSLNITITCNFSSKKDDLSIDKDINKKIAEVNANSDFRIISIDRGEKNLAYCCVMDENANILDIKSLNRITRYDKNGKAIKEKNMFHEVKDGKLCYGEPVYDFYKDYQNLLDEREIKRLVNRRSWNVIEDIKNLKKGYVALLINYICKAVVIAINEGKYPIIVLESLDKGMLHNRVKIEKQIYRGVEEGLVRKLNYFVDKKTDNVLNAWQLLAKFETVGSSLDRKKQLGIIFYVDPGYTSITCPCCGFRQRKYIKAERAEENFKEIKIKFDGKRYSFAYDYRCIDDNGKEKSKEDIIYSNVKRLLRSGRNGRAVQIEDVTDELTNLFKKHNINIEQDINEQLAGKDNKFWKQLLWWFNAIEQIRNTQSLRRKFNTEENKLEILENNDCDFILCPHCYFDSNKDKFQNKIWNGDANGAFNIGRKGIIDIFEIKKHQRMLSDFMEQWGIDKLPKANGGNQAVIEIVKNDKKYNLCILNNKKIPYYCLRIGKEKIDSIADDRKCNQLPDLMVNWKKWDMWLDKWGK